MQTITVNDITMAYTDQGSGEPVVLLHGLGSCKEDWEEQIAALAAHYRVIAPDLRGHGQTSKPKKGYSIKQFAEDIRAFADVLPLNQFHLIGFSLGGMISQQFASTYPQRLKSVVIINATPSVIINNWPLRKMFWGRLLTIRLMGVKRMAKAIAQANFPTEDKAALRQKLEQQFASNDKSAYYRSTRAIMNWDVRPQLTQISCPLLAISSDMDYTPVSLKQTDLVEAVPQGQLQVINNARHLLPMEQPQQLNQALLDWLQQWS